MTYDLDAELRAVLAPMLDMLGDHTEGELAAVEDAVLASWERLLVAVPCVYRHDRPWRSTVMPEPEHCRLLATVRARMGGEEGV